MILGQNKMDIGRIVITLLGASASTFYLIVPELRKMQERKARAEKLRIIREALEEAEKRLMRYEERHDHILSQLCSYYMINPNLEEALSGARHAMNEALQFAVELRKLQIEIISSF
ncbi:hypothetical protein CDL12_29175 [Handroanthus impetiginosus]|uniref:Uncharacterized protein n=1 Tax=Handroanthus impetiginosus TaxID=429701 RepID=A0A2G9FZ55_9LAMI|nr:hypothetical protein CDL12_29175 [Handroanthus impetiginosus]